MFAVNWQSLQKEVDQQNMLALLESFPRQVEEAIEIGRNFDISQIEKTDIRNLVFSGMGGSAIGGDLLKLLGTHQLKVPVEVVRNYFVPEFLSDTTLFTAFSFSGNTEETISAFKHAGEKHARRLVISSGGQLKELCREAHVPFVQIPGGRPPRTALGYLMIPILVILSRLGFFQNRDNPLGELQLYLRTAKEKYRLETETVDNPAKKLALKLVNRVPIIYSSVDMSAVGLRWKGQFSENAKVPAFQNVVPEMNHNEIVGWERVANLALEDKLQVIFLRDSQDYKRIQSRMEITETIVAKAAKSRPIRIESEGEGRLTRLFSFIYLSDFTSYYLALLNKVDPTPIPFIDVLKDTLAKIPVDEPSK